MQTLRTLIELLERHQITERYGQMFVALKDELQIILTIAIAGLKVEERVALQAALDILVSEVSSFGLRDFVKRFCK
jgi:hypothetical protein